MKKTIFIAMLCIFLASPIYAADVPWYRNWWSAEVKMEASKLDTTAVSNIPIPILFGIDLDDFSANFGDPRSGGRTHEGQDILAANGAPIISPTKAVVTHIRYGESAGYSVYTANPGGETFAYLHLQKEPTHLSVGDVLDVGDLIGYVGDTGNAVGTPHLHFEILKDEATDPYPRITKELSLEEKMIYTHRILNALPKAERDVLSSFLARTYKETFEEAEAAGVGIPPAMSYALTTGGSAPVSISTNLSTGSRGTEVSVLQRFLIDADSGSASRELKEVGATGYFGSLTKTALLEYQKKYGLNETGQYDDVTRTYIEQNAHDKTDTTVPETPITSLPSLPTYDTSPVPQVDLELGDRGDAVILLQNILIEKNSGSAAQLLADAGATGYFGSLTKQALVEYQSHHNISPAAGYFGSVTRKEMSM